MRALIFIYLLNFFALSISNSSFNNLTMNQDKDKEIIKSMIEIETLGRQNERNLNFYEIYQSGKILEHESIANELNYEEEMQADDISEMTTLIKDLQEATSSSKNVFGSSFMLCGLSLIVTILINLRKK